MLFICALKLGDADSELITYPYFKGLISLLNNMELMKKIYLQVTEKNKEKTVAQGQSD